MPSQRARYEAVTAGKSSTIIRDLMISSCHGVPRGFGAFPGQSGNRDLVVAALIWSDRDPPNSGILRIGVGEGGLARG